MLSKSVAQIFGLREDNGAGATGSWGFEKLGTCFLERAAGSSHDEQRRRNRFYCA